MITDTMHLFTIDTLKFSRRLQGAGLDKNIADELAEAIAETGDCNMQNIASKRDIRELELKMESQKKEIIIKIGGLMFLGFGMIISILIKTM